MIPRVQAVRSQLPLQVEYLVVPQLRCSSELRLETGLHRAFDEMVRRQLDAVWHTVSWKTRQICKVRLGLWACH